MAVRLLVLAAMVAGGSLSHPPSSQMSSPCLDQRISCSGEPRSSSPLLPADLHPCSKSASLSVTPEFVGGRWSMQWKQRNASPHAVQHLTINFDLGASFPHTALVLQLQLSQGFELRAVKNYLVRSQTSFDQSRCFSFAYEEATPGEYTVNVFLHAWKEKDELKLIATGDYRLRVGNASQPKLLMDHATLEGDELVLTIWLQGMTHSKLLLVVLISELHSIAESRTISVIHMRSSEHVQDVRVLAPARSECVVSVTVSELSSDKEGSLAAIGNLRKFLRLSSCNRTCELENDHLGMSGQARGGTSPLRSGSVHQRGSEVLFSPHPEDVLCNLLFSTNPEQIVAGKPFKLVFQANGLASTSKYRLHLSIRGQEKQMILFTKFEDILGSEGGRVEFNISNAWPWSLIFVANLYDYFTEQENEDYLLAYLSRSLHVMVPCMLSYLWVSDAPLFHGSVPYDQSPFSGPVQASRHPGGDELSLTLATIATLDRAVMLINAAAQWQEHLAVAFYAKCADEVRKLKTFVEEALGPWFRERNRRLEAVLLTACPDEDSGGDLLVFPINMLRKISCAIATTDLVLYADVDMLASDMLASNIRQAYQDGLVSPTELLAIPCFNSPFGGPWPSEADISVQDKRLRVKPAVISEEDLRKNFEACKVMIPGVLCGIWSLSGRWHEAGVFHVGTEYDKWMEAEEAYPVTYILGYEPYLVVNRSAWRGSQGVGLYDDRFVHWGWDKVSFGVEAASLGYGFKVLPKSFLVHGSTAIEVTEEYLVDVLKLALPSKQEAHWGPPDTHGRGLLQHLVSDHYTAVVPQAAIRSCLVRMFKDESCNVSRIHMVQSPTMYQRVGRSDNEIAIEIYGLTRATGYQVSVMLNATASDERGQEKEVRSLFFLLLPQHLVEDPHGMTVSVGMLGAGRYRIRVDLKDLHAAKLFQDEAILASTEQKYEVF
eukprot:768635-Hanusia_phi.AAC.13